MDTESLIELYEQMADEWGWKNIKKLEKRKVWDQSTVQNCYKFNEYTLKSLD
jgi:hypothetical protein